MIPLRAIAASSLLLAACGGPMGTGSVATGQHSLHISVTRPGAVRSAAIGADCPVDCDTTCSRRPFSAGTRVVLDAIPEPGSEFVEWGGPCAGPGQCRFLIQQDTTLLLTFKKSLPPPPPPVAGPRYSVVIVTDAV